MSLQIKNIDDNLFVMNVISFFSPEETMSGMGLVSTKYRLLCDKDCIWKIFISRLPSKLCLDEDEVKQSLKTKTLRACTFFAKNSISLCCESDMKEIKNPLRGFIRASMLLREKNQFSPIGLYKHVFFHDENGIQSVTNTPPPDSDFIPLIRNIAAASVGTEKFSRSGYVECISVFTKRISNKEELQILEETISKMKDKELTLAFREQAEKLSTSIRRFSPENLSRLEDKNIHDGD